MTTYRLLAWLTLLVGVVLAITPWPLHFASDRVAMVDVATGGVIVALLGLALAYVSQGITTDRRVPH
jgi:hypothetical protein